MSPRRPAPPPRRTACVSPPPPTACPPRPASRPRTRRGDGTTAHHGPGEPGSGLVGPAPGSPRPGLQRPLQAPGSGCASYVLSPGRGRCELGAGLPREAGPRRPRPPPRLPARSAGGARGWLPPAPRPRHRPRPRPRAGGGPRGAVPALPTRCHCSLGQPGGCGGLVAGSPLNLCPEVPPSPDRTGPQPSSPTQRAGGWQHLNLGFMGSWAACGRRGWPLV